jgi:signal transduction histidine kinase
MTRLSHHLRGILRDVEHTAYQLHPSSLDHLGLSVALKSYCAEFGKQSGVAIQFSARHLPRVIPQTLALTVYRVVQEALRNAVKHSGSRRASVSVAGKNGSVILTIKDFGRGFNPAAPQKRGLGLISMEERVRQAGGSFSVKATPGAGARIDVRIPVPKRGREGATIGS